jgi:predicted metalloprotease
MAEIDTQKDVYLFLHGRMDLKEKATNALTEKGFSADKVIMALPTKVGNVGDYMAMLWMPPNPDHIKIQQITKVEEVEPEGMVGLWKGASKEDIDSIPLG